MKYIIADFKILYDARGFTLAKLCENYVCDFDKPDFSKSITDTEIDNERLLSNQNYSNGYYESIRAYRDFAEWLPLHNAFVLHSAVFDVDGTGIALAAHSGTGKTTHMLLWQKLLGDRLKIVNGDKPIVRFFDEEPHIPYAYGTPWNGKERLGCNMRTPLKHLCFIERAEKNSCEKMGKQEAVNLIFNQVYMPKDSAAAVETMKLINRLISSCRLWKIKCNMDIEAAETAYNKIFETTGRREAVLSPAGKSFENGE